MGAVQKTSPHQRTTAAKSWARCGAWQSMFSGSMDLVDHRGNRHLRIRFQEIAQALGVARARDRR